MNISLGILDFVLVALAFQGLVMSFLLIHSSRKISSNGWIGAFIFVVAESLLDIEINQSGFLMNHGWLALPLLNLRMTLGPLIYLYTRSLLDGKGLPHRKTYLHFLPVLLDMQHQIVFLLYITGILAIPFVQDIYFSPQTQSYLFDPSALTNIPSFISFSIYAGLSYKLVNAQLHQKNVSAYKLADLKWLKKLLHLLFGIVLIWLLTLAVMVFRFSDFIMFWRVYILYIPAIIFIYWLGMAMYIRQNKMSVAEVVEYNKASKVYFTPVEAKKYEEQLIQLMETGIYLDPFLNLDSLAVKLSLSERAFSNLLNQHIGKNFNDFVNEYRVNEAMKRLTGPDFRQFTIAAIALDCGFNSLATFQRCFKHITGITPSQYQTSLKLVPISSK